MRVRRPLLDFTQALDNEIIVHPEENFRALCDVGTDARRNLVSTEGFEAGDVEQALAQSAVVLERTYNTKANSQAMMEPFCTYTYFDEYGRLTVVSSTQVPFPCSAHPLQCAGDAQGEICVIKPRIGGGFGAKQSVVSELFPALVTKKTGRAAYLCYTRQKRLPMVHPATRCKCARAHRSGSGRHHPCHRSACAFQRRGLR